MNHCPDRDRLERLLDHRLDDTELDEMEQHVRRLRHLPADAGRADRVPRSASLEPGQDISIAVTEAEPGLVVDPPGGTAGASDREQRAHGSGRAHGGGI